MLAASSGETVRILLNSKSERFPTASPIRADWSGSTSWTRWADQLNGQIPALENMPPHNEDGAGGSHSYAPWWLYKEQTGRQARLRARLPHRDRRDPQHAEGQQPGAGRFPGRGLRIEAQAERRGATTVPSCTYACRGEMIPNEDSFAELDPDVKDKWGIPVVRWHWKWSDHELNQVVACPQDLCRDHRGDGREGAR